MTTTLSAAGEPLEKRMSIQPSVKKSIAENLMNIFFPGGMLNNRFAFL